MLNIFYLFFYCIMLCYLFLLFASKQFLCLFLFCYSHLNNNLSCRSSFQNAAGFSENIYNSLVALKEGDEKHFGFLIDEAKLTVLSDNATNGNISTANLYQCLSKLNAVTQLEHYGKQYFW